MKRVAAGTQRRRQRVLETEGGRSNSRYGCEKLAGRKRDRERAWKIERLREHGPEDVNVKGIEKSLCQTPRTVFFQ